MNGQPFQLHPSTLDAAIAERIKNIPPEEQIAAALRYMQAVYGQPWRLFTTPHHEEN